MAAVETLGLLAGCSDLADADLAASVGCRSRRSELILARSSVSCVEPTRDGLKAMSEPCSGSPVCETRVRAVRQEALEPHAPRLCARALTARVRLVYSSSLRFIRGAVLWSSAVPRVRAHHLPYPLDAIAFCCSSDHGPVLRACCRGITCCAAARSPSAAVPRTGDRRAGAAVEPTRLRGGSADRRSTGQSARRRRTDRSAARPFRCPVSPSGCDQRQRVVRPFQGAGEMRDSVPTPPSRRPSISGDDRSAPRRSSISLVARVWYPAAGVDEICSERPDRGGGSRHQCASAGDQVTADLRGDLSPWSPWRPRRSPQPPSSFFRAVDQYRGGAASSTVMTIRRCQRQPQRVAGARQACRPG